MTTDTSLCALGNPESLQSHTHTLEGLAGQTVLSPLESNAKSPGRKMIQTYSLWLISREDRARNTASLFPNLVIFSPNARTSYKSLPDILEHLLCWD